MRAIVKAAAGPGIEVRDVPDPRPRAGEVLVRVEAVSVCGSDISLFRWSKAAQDFNPPLPLVLGHEAAGEIVGVGPGVDEVAVGERVAIESHFYCDDCAACRHEARLNCLGGRLLGFNEPGTFADLAVVPANACFRVRPEVSAIEAALYEPAGVAVHAMQQAGEVAGKTVVITGAGPVGLFLISVLRAVGAGPIAVLEPVAARRQRAESLGATAFGVGQEDDLVAFAKEHGAIDGADVGFEVSGAMSAYELVFRALGKHSKLVSVGHTSRPLSVDISRDVNKRVISWSGVFGRRVWSTWNVLDDLVARGGVKLTDFVDGHIDLEQLPTRYEEVAEAPGKVIVVL